MVSYEYGARDGVDPPARLVGPDPAPLSPYANPITNRKLLLCPQNPAHLLASILCTCLETIFPMTLFFTKSLVLGITREDGYETRSTGTWQAGGKRHEEVRNLRVRRVQGLERDK